MGNMKSKRVRRAEAGTRQAKKRVEHIAKRKAAGAAAGKVVVKAAAPKAAAPKAAPKAK